ncbi:hypothetical protein G7Y89_g1236 [Cudoniella acicularis]|uniref:Uncharacterized protein n=1 Tax=Cudoniella acicularis TaxID=354080 RepID=A0A8H4RXB5_9HELO|nr:hypothetical protein G7Y89_g1236 [Cudoniella acicularis]
MLSILNNSIGESAGPSTQPEVTRASSPISILSSITVDASTSVSNLQSSSSTPPTSIGDSVSVSSSSSKVETTIATPAEETPAAQTPVAQTPSAQTPSAETPSAEATGRSRLEAAAAIARRKTITEATLARARALASTPTETVEEDANQLVHDGIEVLDLQWSVKKLPKSKSQIGLAAGAKKGAKQVDLERRKSVPATSSKGDSLSKRLSVLGKRGRKTFEEGLSGLAKVKTPRELRNLADTPEFAKIDDKPVVQSVWSNGKLVKPESANKKKKKAEELIAVKSKAKIEEAKPAEKKLVNGKREKVWLTKGLYAGQETNLDWFQHLAKEEMSPNMMEFKGTGFMPLPMWHGQRLLHTGRDFKLPFDVCHPLPPGQPKPDEWRKTSSNRFVGDASALWKKADIFDSFSSKCVCTPETGCDERCQNRIMLYECNEDNCAAGRAHCTNRAFADLQERRKGGGKYRIGVEVIKTADRGYGVRSNRCFEPNQIIVEYTGEIITEEECDRRMNEDYKNNECYYLMSFDQNMILDGTKGSIARFVNHSCRPNCRMVKWIVGGKPRMALFAGDNPIMSGDELTYDYNFDPFSAKNVQECRCGSDNCRGVLGPKPKDPKPVKEVIKDVVKAGVKAGKRKLKELLGAEDDEEPRSPKKRKMKEATGVKRSASSASLKVAKNAAKAVKKSVSMQLLNARKAVSVNRSSSISPRKTIKVKTLKTYGRSKAKSSSRTSSLTMLATDSSPSTPEKMTSVGQRIIKKNVVRSMYPVKDGPSARDASEGTIRVISGSDEMFGGVLGGGVYWHGSSFNKCTIKPHLNNLCVDFRELEVLINPFMNTQSANSSATDHSRPQLKPPHLLQSREIGELGAPQSRYATSIAAKPAPVAKSWAHFVAGGIGGMTAATLTAPLDVLKTRLQSDFYQQQLAQSRLAKGISPHAHLSAFRSGLLHFRETFQILGSVHRVEGWRALFKGLGPNLIGVVPARSINFYVVGNGKRIIANYGNNGEESAWVVLCAAALAGIVTSTVTNPIWLIKTRLQLDKNVVERNGGTTQRRYRNSWDCIKQVVRQEGWVLYEQMKKSLAKREEHITRSGRERTLWDNVVSWTGSTGAAGSAKLVAALATYPHEVARTRLRQAPLENGKPKYTGLLQCFKLVWKEEGMVAMYGGLTPHLLRTVPSAAIMFGMYEGILKLLHTED